MTARNTYLLRVYGITEDEYNSILESQHGACFICGKVPREGQRRLSVDHDHKTGIVRGLLCHTCNRGLSWFRDDPERMRRGMRYLRSNPAFWIIGERTVPKKKRSSTKRTARKGRRSTV